MGQDMDFRCEVCADLQHSLLLVTSWIGISGSKLKQEGTICFAGQGDKGSQAAEGRRAHARSQQAALGMGRRASAEVQEMTHRRERVHVGIVKLQAWRRTTAVNELHKSPRASI